MFLDKLTNYIHYNNTLIRENNQMNYVKSNFLLLIAFTLLFSISAFRFNIGWDYLAYYETIKYNLSTNIVSGEEYATIMLIELSRTSGFYNLFFIVNSFICVFFMYKTINKYSVDPWLSLIFFLCFPLYFLNSLSVIRFFTALSITFYGFKYIEQRRPVRYLILVLIAALFHKSAIIAFVFYFARYIKIGTLKLLVIFAIMPYLANILNRFVLKYFPMYAVYTEETTIQEGTKAIYFFLIIALIALLLRKKITINDEVVTIYLNIFFIGIAIYLMFYDQGTMGHRLSLFGTIYGLLILPKIINVFRKGLARVYLKFLFYLLLIVMFLYIVNSGGATYIPYRTIFKQ